MYKSLLCALVLMGIPGLPAGSETGLARAGGCYLCGQGSTPACRDYCRYEGADTFDSRHRCEAKGCRIAGTVSCPSSGELRICQAPRTDGPDAPEVVYRPQCPPVRS